MIWIYLCHIDNKKKAWKRRVNPPPKKNQKNKIKNERMVVLEKKTKVYFVSDGFRIYHLVPGKTRIIDDQPYHHSHTCARVTKIDSPPSDVITDWFGLFDHVWSLAKAYLFSSSLLHSPSTLLSVRLRNLHLVSSFQASPRTESSPGLLG